MSDEYHDGRADGYDEGYEHGRRAGMKEAAKICKSLHRKLFPGETNWSQHRDFNMGCDTAAAAIRAAIDTGEKDE